jgi:hypothetical protein
MTTTEESGETMDITAKVIQVIETHFCRGKGDESDPMRTVTAYYSFDGDFLAEDDPNVLPGGKLRYSPKT